MSQLNEFLSSLETLNNKSLKVKITSKKNISIQPLSFKQQKQLITSKLDGVIGSISFIKTINEIIISNSGEKDLKIYDRIPIILALRKNLSNKLFIKDDVEITVDKLIENFEPFKLEESTTIETPDYTITLRIPTLEQEIKQINSCIEDLKSTDTNNLSESLTLILSHEIPKYLESITYKNEVIKLESLTNTIRNQIIDSLPALVTNKIVDFILKVKEYDEKLVTYDNITVDIDSTFFE